MTDKERDLLAYIIDHPDDDTARLVTADYYSENGNEARGEFIRVSVAADQGLDAPAALRCRELFADPAARGRTGLEGMTDPMHRQYHNPEELPGAMVDPDTLSVREQTRHDTPASSALSARYVNPLRTEIRPVTVGWRLYWVRGFVTRVECEWFGWARLGDWLTMLHPVAGVEFTSRPQVERVLSYSTHYVLSNLPRKPKSSANTQTPTDDTLFDLLRGEWPTVRDWGLYAGTTRPRDYGREPRPISGRGR